MSNGNIIKCFNPIIDKNCEILILGSMPSVISRENNFYYSNPLNRFWKLLSSIFNEDFITADNNKKTELLLKHHIALFDVYSCCEMKKEDTSLDSHIKNQKFNDIPNLIKGTKISKIYITSKKAYDDFIKRFEKVLISQNISITYLPSPSSANKKIYRNDDQLLNAWKELM